MNRALFIFLLLMAIHSLPAAPIAHSQGNEAALFSLLNELRARNGVQRVTQNESLRAAAAEQARWMAQTGQIQHTHDGSAPRGRAAAAGFGSPWVSEVIYMSPNTSHIPAWNFWLNSPNHYPWLIYPAYEQVGIASYSEGGRKAYVMVLGNLSGAVPPPVSGEAPSASSDAAVEPNVPSGLVGQDEHGYILHRIQPGETLGDLALQYGYRTWDVVLTMEAINDIDRYSLAVGDIVRIPPYDGTWTPAPAAATAAPSATAAVAASPPTIAAARSTVTPAPTSTPRPTVLIGGPRVLDIASATPPPPVTSAAAASDSQRRSIIIALIIALGLQGALLLGIGAVYLRQRGRA